MTDDAFEWLPHDWTAVTNMQGTTFLDPEGAQYSESEAKSILFPAADEYSVEKYAEPHIARQVAPVQTWLDSDPVELKAALALRGENRKNVMEWVSDALVENADFGRIHVMPKKKCDKGNQCTNEYHYSKPCLWKAGAEKITGMLGLRADWPDLADARDKIMEGNPRVVLRCELVNPYGDVVSQGIGGRALDEDYNNINKCFKMAKKSSLIDAVLNACGLSEVFTQDIVDDDKKETIYESTLDESGVRYLLTAARELFGPSAEATVSNLCRRRFHVETPDLIPAYRLQDAIRSLEEKAAEIKSETTDDN